MFCLSVLMAVGMTELCLGMSLHEPPHQEQLCPLQHSCSFRGTNNFFYPGCSCDATCKIYGDCCRDSEYYNEAEQIKALSEYTCVDYSKETTLPDAVYTRGKCSHDWDNAEVQKLCLMGNTLPDPTKSLPVTSTTTARTYVNHYCAICNGEDPASLRIWYAEVVCLNQPRKTHNEDYAVVFRNRTWGIIVPSLGLSSFTACTSYVTMPEDIRNFTIPCVPTVKTCFGSGSQENERTLCQSYAAPVYVGDLGFRNKHCAACNGYKNYSCVMESLGHITPRIFSLGHLLDFHDKSGSNDVGFTDRCGPGKVWDDKFKKCRELICPNPNDVFSGGSCHPKSQG